MVLVMCEAVGDASCAYDEPPTRTSGCGMEEAKRSLYRVLNGGGRVAEHFSFPCTGDNAKLSMHSYTSALRRSF